MKGTRLILRNETEDLMRDESWELDPVLPYMATNLESSPQEEAQSNQEEEPRSSLEEKIPLETDSWENELVREERSTQFLQRALDNHYGRETGVDLVQQVQDQAQGKDQVQEQAQHQRSLEQDLPSLSSLNSWDTPGEDQQVR